MILQPVLTGRYRLLCATMIAICVLSGIDGSARAQQANVPKSVQADLIKADIFDAVKANQFSVALNKFEELRRLEPTPAPALLFLEAKLADKTEDSLRAMDTIATYFNLATRDDKNYGEALGLMRRNQVGAEAMRKVKASEAQAKLDRILPGLSMVAIPGGNFQMGDSAGNGSSDEKPVHSVTVKPFKMGAYEVTMQQFDQFATATGRTLPNDSGFGRGNQPVIHVSWDDANAFIAWLNQQGVGRFRLPSEAEWEYAARAGTTTDYFWGTVASHEQANYGDDACCKGLARGRDQWANTSPVGSFPANSWGLYDMIGNVWEWTADCYNSSYNGAPVDGSAWTAGECARRVFRGGSWFNDPTLLRVSGRYWNVSTFRYFYLGFRLAQDP